MNWTVYMMESCRWGLDQGVGCSDWWKTPDDDPEPPQDRHLSLLLLRLQPTRVCKFGQVSKLKNIPKVFFRGLFQVENFVSRHVKFYDVSSYKVVHSMDFMPALLSVGIPVS